MTDDARYIEELRNLAEDASNGYSMSVADVARRAVACIEAQAIASRSQYDVLLTTWAESRKRHLTAEASLAVAKEALETAKRNMQGMMMWVPSRVGLFTFIETSIERIDRALASPTPPSTGGTE